MEQQPQPQQPLPEQQVPPATDGGAPVGGQGEPAQIPPTPLASAGGDSSNPHQFGYLIIVDFVRTGGKNPANWGAASDELISFSWVVIETKSRQVLDAKSLHVCPQWSFSVQPWMTESCGLTEDILRTAPMLHPALQQFDEYLTSKYPAGSFIFLTDGAEALQALKVEAARKKIELKPYFDQYMDICAQFQQTHPEFKQGTGLQKILDFLGITNPAEPGTEKCRVLTSIVEWLWQHNHTFSGVEKVVIPASSITSGSEPTATTGASADQPRSETGGVVRLRGLPFQASEQDIREFFHDLQVAQNGVQIALNREGRPSGDAYVQFATEEDAKKALEYDRRSMGRRYIEVFSATFADMNSASAASRPQPVAPVSGHEDAFVVRLRGLPYSATEDDIRNFLLPAQAVGVHIARNREGRPSGDAFVEVPTADAQDIIIKKHGEKMGIRYVETFKSSHSEMNSALTPRAPSYMPPPPMGATGMDTIRLRGMPWSATEHDVFSFFQPSGVMPLRVHFLYDRTNRPSGDAYAVFQSPADVEQAMRRDRERMGSRYVELFRSTQMEAYQAVNPGASGYGGPSGYGGGGFGGSSGYGGPSGYGGGGAYGGAPYGGGYPSSSPYGGGYPSSAPGYPSGYGAPGYGASAGGAYGGSSYGGAGGYPQGGYGGAGAASAGYGGSSSSMPGGLTIRARGLPYRCSREDLLEFFRGYNPVPESISLVMGPDGRPSGEAFISFLSENDASRAMRDLNRKYLGERYVTLSSA
ncbi:putative Epithelial splicing regulatory protein 2 [Paratrimastix pyriformis]|uniref:Epithelial splicing regulatory protein 2 n=1 Tax=Paratrimastix pyriformis TaxID=342808 RepID=A0ABQ8UNQ8_9EUKA|nr:putative Epithelial splicing regulatory protein 2 [Paratrimastix pyriformis]